jgi:CheY-like chemotaxis protein
MADPAPGQLKILCIEDSKDMVETLVALLTADGFTVFSASDPRIGLGIAQKVLPDLILMDIMMPGMNGYDVCRLLQQDRLTAGIPVVFLSALTQAQNKVSALSVGGLDYLTKPFTREELRAITQKYAGKKAAPAPAPAAPARVAVPGARHTLADFKKSVIEGFKLEAAAAAAVGMLTAGDIYKLSGILGVSRGRVARLLADFVGRPCLPVINPDDLSAGLLPAKFAEQNNVAAVNTAGGAVLLAMQDPFNLELHDMIRGIMGSDFEYAITEPSNISALYRLASDQDAHPQKIPGQGMAVEEPALARLRGAVKSVKNEMNEPKVKYLTGRILQFLGEEKGAAVRMDVSGTGYLVTAGAPGAMAEFVRLSRMDGNMVAARLKTLGGMDLLERRSPQTGSFFILCGVDPHKLSLRTEPSDVGESLMISPA